MIEVVGDLWTYPADIRCITTNGTIKADGRCVMGRGCALEAARQWPTLPQILGEHLRYKGNHVGWLYGGNVGNIVLSFPVKHEWFQKADLELIKRSAKELMRFPAVSRGRTVVLPRPGCGNGRLTWDEVKPVLAPILGDNVFVITKG